VASAVTVVGMVLSMSIAISDDHADLAKVVAAFLVRHDARAAARALLEAPEEGLPAYWPELCALGWPGLHLGEDVGGSGFGIPELVVVVEELARAVAPGPFVPTVIASAVIDAVATGEVRTALLPGLADGSVIGAVALSAEVDIRDGKAYGPAGTVVSGGVAELFLVPVGADVAVVRRSEGGVATEVPANLDPARRSARLTLDAAPSIVLSGARARLDDFARLLFAAEAVGLSRECTESAAAYAKIRIQFGRPIGTFQAIKHHCANMLVGTEIATAGVWAAARAAAAGGDEFSLAAAMAVVLAVPAADEAAQLNIQVHGGIGFTWEHDAHLYLRRATLLKAVLDTEVAGAHLMELTGRGVQLSRSIDLPPEAEPIREQVMQFADGARGLEGKAALDALIESGYVMPHWPKPWGRDADAVEQLVVEEEFAKAGIVRPNYGITGWVILTLIQYATEEQVGRWVRPAMEQEVTWCQLFSEPDAGSDAAGIKTRATKTDGGWLINGQKVWTSGAHLARFGFATVRTDPDAPKHRGITTMVIDMKAKGVLVRPLKMITGMSEFNEVFFDDVFIPDADVVGPINDGWTVARATLGNESLSIGASQSGFGVPVNHLIDQYREHSDRLGGGSARIGRHIARMQAIDSLNLRRAHRAVGGSGPGPEGAVTKLVSSENVAESAAISVALAGGDGAFLEGPGAISGLAALYHRGLAIAGGSSEIKRNQIGERILGLPRDPLIN
jgi:3-oxochol-4-en-24-oyl-CoA dehydrogenase